MEVFLKNALIMEPFDQFQKFKRLNWLEFNFLLIEHSVRFKLSTRQRDQRDKIPKMLYGYISGIYQVFL